MVEFVFTPTHWALGISIDFRAQGFSIHLGPIQFGLYFGSS